MENPRAAGDGGGAARRKPAGGFCFITGMALLGAWWAYRRGFVTRLDIRVWLACFEAVARRCRVPRGCVARFTVVELRELVGSDSDEEIRRSIRRLTARGLVCWSEASVRVGQPVRALCNDEQADLDEHLAQVPNHRRRIPVPRRVIRLLARTGTRVSIATVFGHLLRCLFYRGHECRPTGTCKASWIAAVFNVDPRNVKEARMSLVKMALLRMEPVGQNFLNRHGPLVTVNLEWASAPAECRGLPPPRSIRRDDSPPPIREPELLRILTNQNRAAGRDAGAERERERNGKPSLRHVVPADLTDAARLACLFKQACVAGYVQPTESDRLKFFASAEHARAVATCNAPGLFAANVRERRWGVITLADEDAARRRLRCERDGGRGRTRPKQGGEPAAVRDVVGSVLSELRMAEPFRLAGRDAGGVFSEEKRVLLSENSYYIFGQTRAT